MTSARLSSADQVKAFVLAGNATLTVVSRASGSRYTFKFTRPDEVEGRDRPLFVNVLTGQDNETGYSYAGVMWTKEAGWTFRPKKGGRVSPEAPSVKAAVWFLLCLSRSPDRLLEQCEVWHEGRCGRCGRKLTVPESIETGFGPECMGRLS